MVRLLLLLLLTPSRNTAVLTLVLCVRPRPNAFDPSICHCPSSIRRNIWYSPRHIGSSRESRHCPTPPSRIGAAAQILFCSLAVGNSTLPTRVHDQRRRVGPSGVSTVIHRLGTVLDDGQQNAGVESVRSVGRCGRTRVPEYISDGLLFQRGGTVGELSSRQQESNPVDETEPRGCTLTPSDARVWRCGENSHYDLPGSLYHYC